MAMVACLWAGMEVVDGMHVGHSMVGGMSGGFGALPECEVIH